MSSFSISSSSFSFLNFSSFMYNFPLFHLFFAHFSILTHWDNFLDVITEHDLQHDKLTHVTSDATEIEMTLTSYDKT